MVSSVIIWIYYLYLLAVLLVQKYYDYQDNYLFTYVALGSGLCIMFLLQEVGSLQKRIKKLEDSSKNSDMKE